MMLTGMKLHWILLLAAASLQSFASTPAKISVNVAEPGHEIPRMLWGVFFEDINLSADGGIYPELVKNRSFEDADRPESWNFSTPDGTSAATVVTAQDNPDI